MMEALLTFTVYPTQRECPLFYSITETCGPIYQKS